METGSPRRETVEQLAEEFVARYRRGERPPLSEYTDRYPDHAEQIRDLFPALVMMEQIAPSSESEALSGFEAFPHRRPVELPEQIGDYRILREIGRGGMGIVYEAEQMLLGRHVALKLLRQQVFSDRTAHERFRREARAAARLHHTNIVPVFEVGREGDLAFYAMQLIQGQGLDQVIDELRRLRARDPKSDGNALAGPGRHDAPATVSATLTPVAAWASPRQRDLSRVAESLFTGRLPTEGLEFPAGAGHSPAPAAPDLSRSAVLPGGTHVSEVDTSGRRQPFFRSIAQIGRQAAQGLAYAHARGIVHRDIKPSNLLLDTAGIVWITDFGLAKDDDAGLTATGEILGTLRYMAPERFRGEGDARADIYALGLTLYELLTLRPAYDSSDRLKVIASIKAEEPARPRLLDDRIPRDLETIVLKAIDKDPERRYATADTLAEDLRRFLADEPIRARQVSTLERYWRWARRNPGIAVLGGVLTTVLVLVTIGSLLAAGRFARLAEQEGQSATAERSARREADQARKTAETARAAAQAETYRALLSEVKALRAGHQPGWRDEALANLARLAVMPTPRRDLVQLRTEAVASIGEFDVHEVARFQGGTGPRMTEALAFSADGNSLVAARDDGELQLWDVAARRHAGTVPAAAVGPDGAGNPPAPLPVASVRYLPDGAIAYASTAHCVAFLDLSGRLPARSPIDGGAAQVNGLSVDHGGQWLAVGWSDGHIGLYDAATGAVRRTIRGDGRHALSPDGQWLATRGTGNSVLLRRTDVDTPPITLGRHHGHISALAFSPDGTTLATTSWDRTTTLWDVARREERLALRGHKDNVGNLAFSPNGAWVATTGEDYTTRIWDARDGQALAILPGPGFMRAVAFSPDGNYLAATGNGTVLLYQLTGRRERRRLVGHGRGAQCLASHPQEALLASGADDQNIIVWDPTLGRPLQRWATHGAWVTTLAYSADGSILASGWSNAAKQADHSVHLWDARTGTLRTRLLGNTANVKTLAFDPTGRRLASGDNGGTVLLFDVDSGRILRREKVGNSDVTSVVFLGGGRHLLVGLRVGSVALFDLEQSGPPRRIALPAGCNRLVVDSRTNRVLIGDSRGAVIALSLPDLRVVHRLAKGHDQGIASLALSSDGRLLATGGRDRHVVLRDALSFEPWLTFPAWTGMVKDIAFDASGRWLAFAGADSDVSFWDMGMVHDELAAVGLAWDQAAPPSASTTDLASVWERPKPQIPVIRPNPIAAAEIAKAQGLLTSGIEANKQRDFTAAVVDLQQASEQFQAFRKSLPGDPGLARYHGNSLRFLAGSLRDSKRPIEALARARESLAVQEWLNDPNPGDLYNMACACALVSAQLDHGAAR